jgi:hypothetical protein
MRKQFANHTNLMLGKRAARIHQNPRLLKISFVTFRHWGGTMIAQYTNGNVLSSKTSGA